MPLVDQERARELVALAERRFDPELWEAERRVLADSAASADPEKPEPESPRQPVRSSFLRWLVTDAEASQWIDQGGDPGVWGAV